MRVFDFDGTIYDGESLFDLYLFSAKYNPKVLRYIAPVLRYAIKYKLGRATFDQMEYGVGKLCHGYLSELAESLEFEELVNAFWDQNMKRIKPWYEPREDDVILTASFDITVGEACRRLGVQHLVSSTIDGNTLNVNYLNFNTNKPKRFRERIAVHRPGTALCHQIQAQTIPRTLRRQRSSGRILHRQPIRPAHDRHGPTCLHGQRQQNPSSQIAGKAGTEYGGKGRS